ncbi:FAD-binding protein [Sulfidibacter corallicola]|uniref:FAD-binding protein n=1 Tax=Sulfidibacter corallicola TaxID=2818388 RepID=A0A8A4TPL6_SULCO|nr:FAD-linked oxidase C-terminal domain-containing protein [Sulfidibacter corallicola]QTD51916.1 FAD-binding protein [Sulfidibacter corallicola]
MALDPRVRKKLIRVLGSDYVKDDPITCYSYRCDGLTLHPAEPQAVLYPADRDQLVAAVRILSEQGISFLPRGAGTGLSGGAVPREGSVLIEMVRFRAIGPIDPVNRTIEVEPGVVNLHVSHAAQPHGLYFVPDPSSQKACSVGGNVGENSGGPHTLKYGVTVNHVVGLEVVLPDGEVVELGGPAWTTPGPDLLSLFIGSEGTLGIVTKIICRLTPLPERVHTMLAVFGSVREACESVSAIIRAGIVPAALEMIDRIVIQAIEQTIGAGFPTDAEAVLIVELEDLREGLDAEAEQIETILRANGAVDVRQAADEAERALIWRARKEAFGALGSISPSFYTQDGVIPRSALPRVLERILAIGAAHGLTIANVFHAGDGNLHPLILYNSRDPAEIEATHQAGREILETCLAEGGSLSGEHGIGLEKSHLMDGAFDEVSLNHMKQVRAVFNPRELLNPGKIFPQPGRCGELKGRPGDAAAQLRAKSGIRV